MFDGDYTYMYAKVSEIRDIELYKSEPKLDKMVCLQVFRQKHTKIGRHVYTVSSLGGMKIICVFTCHPTRSG